LLLGLALEKANDDHGHVVTANSAGVAVGGKAVVHHVLANGREFLFGYDSAADELDDGLGRLTIPDTWMVNISGFLVSWNEHLTVTRNDKELVVLAELMGRYIGESSDDLLFRREVGALLELEIANCAGEGKVAIDATEVNESASRLDTRLFAFARLAQEPEQEDFTITYLRSAACGHAIVLWRVL
jgi:hypothetical protein